MEFKRNQSIYLQIADQVYENILAYRWKEGDRIPSIREMSVSIEVNPNTVLRSYAYLQDQDIIHNQRGIGYFVSAGAHQRTRFLKRKAFVEFELPAVFRTMDLLSLSFKDLKALYQGMKEEKS